MNIVEAMYRRWSEGEGDDSWGDITTEPEGVEYRDADADGVPVRWAEPAGADPGRVMVYAHGGGFVGGSLDSHRKLAGHLARATGLRVLLTHYRPAPEFRYPAQIEDVLTAYRWVVGQGLSTVLAGDSSGGGLALLAAVRVRDEGLPQPAALLLISPWVDLAQTGASYESNAGTDLVFTREMVRGLVEMYLADRASPKDPQVSPLYADLSGLPPMFVQVGADETLLDEARMLAERADASGVDVRLDVFDGQLHTFQMGAGNLAAADEAIGRFGEWLRPRL